jgi:hypothetical protein
MGETAAVSVAMALGRLLGRAVCLLLLFTGPAAAQPLDPPAGTPVLHIHGAISRTNAADGAWFDLDMLDGLGTVTIETATPWTEGVQRFEGPLLADVLAAAGASGDAVLVRALNDYEAEIPLATVAEVPMILATRRDGMRMEVRDRGPLWIMLPFDERPELNVDLYYRFSVWQVAEILVR